MTLDATRVWFFVLVVAISGLNSAAQHQRVRTLPHDRVPIEQRLQPNNQVVEIDYWAEVVHPYNGAETREQMIARLTRETDLVATIRIAQVTGQNGLERRAFPRILSLAARYNKRSQT